VFTSIRHYIGENPNVFQIVSTFVIGVAAFVIWKFVSKAPPQNKFDSLSNMPQRLIRAILKTGSLSSARGSANYKSGKNRAALLLAGFRRIAQRMHQKLDSFTPKFRTSPGLDRG